MRSAFALAAATLSGQLLAAGEALGDDGPDKCIAVYVKSAHATGGFSDPDKKRADSTRDLIKKLNDSTVERLGTEEEALIVLEVLSRETTLDQNHPMTALFGGRGQKHSSVTVRLTAGDFTADLTGTAGPSGATSAYGKAAAKVVKNIDGWVTENRKKLDEIAAQRNPRD
jgi:hypothetical protein